MQTLFFTIKEWNRFDWNKQQVLTKKYAVILTDYKTRKEKMLQVLNQINFKNFNKGIEGFNKIVQQIGNSMGSLTREMSKDIEKSNKEFGIISYPKPNIFKFLYTYFLDIKLSNNLSNFFKYIKEKLKSFCFIISI